jgi:8-amino-7-oxononanoate synthase
VVGNGEEHRRLEARLAKWLQTEAVLTFSSGYAANLGTLSALVQPEDLVLSDQLNHASIVDGLRLARVPAQVVPHLELDAIDRSLRLRPAGQRAWVITESYFSMDADGPDLKALRNLCDHHNAALVLDEAHALGVFGPAGRGRAAEAGIVPDVLIGAFGKAFGAAGGFVAGCTDLIHWLWNRARSFVYSTGISPVLAALVHDALDEVESDERRSRLNTHTALLRRTLHGAGLQCIGMGPIVPVVFGSDAAAQQCADALAKHGFHVPPLRPPTVPEGTTRLRFTASAAQQAADFDDLAAALRMYSASF